MSAHVRKSYLIFLLENLSDQKIQEKKHLKLCQIYYHNIKKINKNIYFFKFLKTQDESDTQMDSTGIETTFLTEEMRQSKDSPKIIQ